MPDQENTAVLGQPPSLSFPSQVYCGDLVTENFGLSTAQWDEIAAKHTTFIHNGADVNFSCAVEDLIPCNVAGTRTALRLAAQGGMHFCHVSSLSVFSLYHFVGDASQKRPDPRSQGLLSVGKLHHRFEFTYFIFFSKE